MSLRNDTSSAALVFTQYSLCSYASDLSLALRDLHRLRRSTNHPSAALDPVIARIARVREEIRDEIESISDILSPRTADDLACA